MSELIEKKSGASWWARHFRSRRPRRHPSHLQWRRYIEAIFLLAMLTGLTTAYYYFTGDERVRLKTIAALVQIAGGDHSYRRGRRRRCSHGDPKRFHHRRGSLSIMGECRRYRER